MTSSVVGTATTDVGEDEWNRYVSSHPLATVDHLWGWRDIFEEVFRQQTVYVGVRRGTRLAGVLPLVLFRSRLFGRFVVSVPYLNDGGLLADDPDAATALVLEATSVASAFGASHVELRHRARQLASVPCRQHKLGFVLPLTGGSADLWTDIDRKARNQVRKAQKEGLTAVAGGSDLLDAFYGVFARNMRDLGTPVYPARLFRHVVTRFNDLATVFVVRRDQTVLAGALALRFRDTVLVPWASSLREYRHLCPNMLLYWTMLEAAQQRGAQTFDFGRSSPGGGTHQFKRQWGAREVPLHWEYVLLNRAAPPDQGPSNPKFGMAIGAWKRMPLWLANSVGPSIARHLP